MAKKQKHPQQPTKVERPQAPPVAPPGVAVQDVAPLSEPSRRGSSASTSAPQSADPRRGRIYPIGYVLAEVVVDKVRAQGNDGKGRRDTWRRGQFGVFSPSVVASLPGVFDVADEVVP